MTQRYIGSCHCGAIRFEVFGEPRDAMACNCSICSRKGSLLWFVPRDKLHVLSANDNTSAYTFHMHVIQHRFCKICGIHPYAEGSDPAGNQIAAINLRCLEGLDIGSLPVTHYDGRSA